MRKITALASGLALGLAPFLAEAKMYSMMDGSSRGFMNGGAGMLWTHLLGAVVLAIWGVVGVLACAWLWQHLKK